MESVLAESILCPIIAVKIIDFNDFYFQYAALLCIATTYISN